MAASMTMVDTTRHSLVQTIIVIAVAAILFAAALSWFFIGQALSPLVDITESALRISGADDLSQRIPQRGPENDEMGRLVTAFNDTLGRLEQLFTSQQRFLADVSHELRTPLTVIKGNVDLMRRMKQVDEESLDNIEDEADRLTRSRRRPAAGDASRIRETASAFRSGRNGYAPAGSFQRNAYPGA